MSGAPHIPPLRYHALTRFYDLSVRATTREARWRPALVAQAALAPGLRVLDLGCGTGTLALLLARAAPGVRVTGLDADARALGIARAKARDAGLAIDFEQAPVEEAAFAPASFDRIVSSLVLHHLAPAAKRRALDRAHGWLRPGGELHVADWGRAERAWQRVAFLSVQLLDGFETTRDHVAIGLEPFLREAGFDAVAETCRFATPLGVLSLYRGTKR